MSNKHVFKICDWCIDSGVKFVNGRSEAVQTFRDGDYHASCHAKALQYKKLKQSTEGSDA